MGKELETTTKRTPKIKLESTKKVFYYNGAVVYNSLPLEIRTKPLIMIFARN